MITAFNRDEDARKLMSFLNQKSYLEIYNKNRDEECHSHFLAWLLRSEDINCNNNESPFMWFLQAVMCRINTGECGKHIPPEFYNKVVTQNLQYDNLCVSTEKKVKDIAANYFNSNWSKHKPSEDEIDIFITCDIKNCPLIDNIEIVIENKVTSPEEGPKKSIKLSGYDDKYQTVRYYQAVNSTAASNKLQLFVYLKPGEVPPTTEAECKKYIQMNYQDILDYILTPMLNGSDINERTRWMLQDYVDALSIPTLDTKSTKRIVMALSQEQVDIMQKVWNKHNQLLKKAVDAYRDKIWEKTTVDLLLIAFVDSHKDFIASFFEIAATYHPVPNIRKEANYYSNRISSKTPCCIIDGNKDIIYKVAEAACEFAKRYVNYYKHYGFKAPANDLSNMILNDSRYTTGKVLPHNLFDAIKSTNNVMKLDYNNKGDVAFNKNCWQTGSSGHQFQDLMDFINNQKLFSMTIECV